MLCLLFGEIGFWLLDIMLRIDCPAMFVSWSVCFMEEELVWPLGIALVKTHVILYMHCVR